MTRKELMGWVNCKKHPRYQGKRQPRAACEPCWRNWFRELQQRAIEEHITETRKRLIEANGGKDRTTPHCTELHHPSTSCYGCEDRG